MILFHKKLINLFLIIFVFQLILLGQASACTNNEDGIPGVIGEIEYFYSENQYKYCDGNNWRTFKHTGVPINRNQVYSNDFESGLLANEWGPDITANYSQFLGRLPGISGQQGPNKTFTLSGSQDTTTITFDFYRFDNFGSSFRIYLDDVMVISDPYQSVDYNVPSGGTNGNISWTVSSPTPISGNFVYGGASEQIYTYTMIITNPGVTSMKIGFGTTGYGSTNVASWGLDNVQIQEVTGGAPSVIYSENFESGIAPGDWGFGETVVFSTFLGRFSTTGNGQGTNKTIPLSGFQDTTTITFDFYEIDSWDNEQFTLFIDDNVVFSTNFSGGAYNVPSGGSNGNVSWSVSNITMFLIDSGFDTNYADQTYRYTLTITNPGSTSVKMGFGNNLNEGLGNESVGIDNISVVENIGGTPTTVFTEDFELPLPANDWGAPVSVTIDGMFGRFNGTSNAQGPNKNFTLPGTQDTTTITFDFYEIGSWENEIFSVYIDDVNVISENFNSNVFDSFAGGVNGNVSWNISNVTPISADFGFEGSPDQVYNYTITITNPGSTSFKLGFGSNLNNILSDESWAIDNLDIVTTQSGTDTGVFNNDFNTPVWPYEWNWNRGGQTILTKFLGRHAGTGGSQALNRTFTLSGAQNTTTVEFDFYEIDTWDFEEFRTFVNDVQIFSDVYRVNLMDIPSSGTVGNVTYSGQNSSGGSMDMGFWNYADQIVRYTMVIANPGAPSLKLGFGATLNEGLGNEAFGIDNVRIFETASGVDSVIYEDNFEGSVTGWSDNSSETGAPSQTFTQTLSRTESEGDYDLDFSATEVLAPASIAMTTSQNGGANFTNHLGRFSNTGRAQGPNKTFILPGTQDVTTLTFDFYEIDTWDTNIAESFYVYIDDILVYTIYLSGGAFDIPLGNTITGDKRLAFNLTTSNVNLGYGSWADQRYRYIFEFENPGATSIKLGFGARLNEDVTNESWGIDNVSVVTHEISGAASEGACTNEALMYYDLPTTKWLWCDGTNLWKVESGIDAVGVCSVDSSLDFDYTNKVFRYCDGANWLEITNEGFN